MALGRKTQKQIAARHQGNLRYFRNPGPLKKLRFWLCFFALLIGSAGIYFSLLSTNKTLYNTGPISSTHAAFSQDCQVCHQASNGSIIHEKLIPLLTTWKEHGISGENPFQEKPSAFFAHQETNSACVHCHEAQTRHIPDWFSLATLEYSSEIVTADSGSCATCHQEHLSSGPIPIPDSSSCQVCHNDPHRLQASSRRIPLNHKKSVIVDSTVTPLSSHQRLSDGAVHFVPKVASGHPAPTFPTFSQGHPDFSYQGSEAKDPNTLKFNHLRHFETDIPPLNGQRLACNDCHKTTSSVQPDFPITYANNCATCHSLQFDPDNSELTLPHGNPEAVRTYLRSLPYQYAELAKRKGLESEDAAKQFTFQALTKLKARMLNGENFENQVFFTANPYRSQNPAGERAFFPGCVYCHEVKQTTNKASNKPSISITLPETIDRWLTHGNFPHSNHTHIACIDCHGVDKSTKTSDILLPTKASCVECHRPSDNTQTGFIEPSHIISASAQRLHGGVRNDCTACHRFHPDGITQSLILKRPDLFPPVGQPKQ